MKKPKYTVLKTYKYPNGYFTAGVLEGDEHPNNVLYLEISNEEIKKRFGNPLVLGLTLSESLAIAIILTSCVEEVMPEYD